MTPGWSLLMLSCGYGFGLASADWPGGLAAGAIGVVLAVVAFVFLYREMKGRTDA